LWERLFVLSTIALLATIFVGTLNNSVKEYPNYPYYAVSIALVWLIIVIVGLFPNND
jgi:hypothetical protein